MELSVQIKYISSLNLSWLQVLPYNINEDYGSYLSENYLGLARILKWFYLNMNSLTQIYQVACEFPEDDKNIKERIVKDLQHWLISRDISIGDNDGRKFLKQKLIELAEMFIDDPLKIDDCINNVSSIPT